MGIPAGVVLVVEGGCRGKSTLLSAVERGVYDHVPGDVRERVVTDRRAVKIRAEDGRSVEGAEIGPFISNLPFGRETGSFSTQDASGSASQAANVSAKGRSTILFGAHAIDLSHVEGIADISQTRAIGAAILYLREKYLDGKKTLAEALALVERDLDEEGLDIRSPSRRGDYAMPRVLEVAAALNRLRTLRCG